MSGKLTLLDPAEQPTTRIIRRVTRRRPNLDSGPGVNSALDVAPGAQPPVLGSVFTSESGGSHRSLHVHRTVAFLIPERLPIAIFEVGASPNPEISAAVVDVGGCAVCPVVDLLVFTFELTGHGTHGEGPRFRVSGTRVGDQRDRGSYRQDQGDHAGTPSRKVSHLGAPLSRCQTPCSRLGSTSSVPI